MFVLIFTDGLFVYRSCNQLCITRVTTQIVTQLQLQYTQRTTFK